MAPIRCGSRAYLVLLTFTVVCAAIFAAASVAHAVGEPTDVPGSAFVSAHTSLQLLTISASLSIFGIRWTSGRLTKSLPNLLVGMAFLCVGVLHLFHVLSYPGLLEPLGEGSYDASSYFRLIAKFALVATLLAVAILPLKRTAEPSDSIIIVLGAVAFILVAFYAVALETEALPSVNSEDGGLTDIGRGLEYVCVALFGLAALRYAFPGGARREATHMYVAAALVAGAFGELSISLHGQSSNLVVLTGYFLEFASFLILFLGLLKESIAMPFETLMITRKVHERDQTKIDRRTKEAEEAKLRAQAHMDFLAHDVSNIISPIVSYSEMLLADANLTPQQRKYVEAMLKLGRRGGAFVANLRRLADAEAVPPDAFVGMDLGRALVEMEEVVRGAHPNKVILLAQSIPSDEQAIVPGGAHIEDVIYEILKNLVEDVPGNSVQLSIVLKKVKDKIGRHYWQATITRFGHIFPPETLAEAQVIYDPKRGTGRGIASSYSFCSSIVNHFGGSLRIENSQKSDAVESSRAIVVLPTAQTLISQLRND